MILSENSVLKISLTFNLQLQKFIDASLDVWSMIITDLNSIEN